MSRISVTEIREKGLRITSGGPRTRDVAELVLDHLLRHLDALKPRQEDQWAFGYDQAVMDMLDFRDSLLKELE
jgi:hypothetical protein